MRKVNRNWADVPPILQSAGTFVQLNQIAINADKDSISDNTYKGIFTKNGQKVHSVRDKLNLYYHSKCAYCEVYCKAEIEHYRPKKEVKEDSTHQGYYWLCYEWSNLLPSCRYCNTEGGKGIQFPILGVRVTLPTITAGQLDTSFNKADTSPLILERPYLLHPEIDDPKSFLAFRIATNKSGIELVGIDAEQRGMETIKICNLNREYLGISRLKNVFEPIRESIDSVFMMINEGVIEDSNLSRALEIQFRQIEKNAANDTLEHTLLHWFITDTPENFETYFAPYIDNANQRLIVVEAFKAYKNV